MSQQTINSDVSATDNKNCEEIAGIQRQLVLYCQKEDLIWYPVVPLLHFLKNAFHVLYVPECLRTREV